MGAEAVLNDALADAESSMTFASVPDDVDALKPAEVGMVEVDGEKPAPRWRDYRDTFPNSGRAWFCA